LLLQALLLLPLTGMALRLLGFKRWQSVLASLSPLGESSRVGQASAPVQQAQVSARMVQAAACHGPYRASCLPESLTLWWLLRRQRIHSDLRIGVRKLAGRFEAHAWVECQGVALNDSDAVHLRFLPFHRAIIAAVAGPQ
jgi:hypothetical protein